MQKSTIVVIASEATLHGGACGSREQSNSMQVLEFTKLLRRSDSRNDK